MTEIWPDYVAQAFLPPPGLNRQFRTAGPDRVKREVGPSFPTGQG